MAYTLLHVSFSIFTLLFVSVLYPFPSFLLLLFLFLQTPLTQTKNTFVFPDVADKDKRLNSLQLYTMYHTVPPYTFFDFINWLIGQF